MGYIIEKHAIQEYQLWSSDNHIIKMIGEICVHGHILVSGFLCATNFNWGLFTFNVSLIWEVSATAPAPKEVPIFHSPKTMQKKKYCSLPTQMFYFNMKEEIDMNNGNW